MWSGWRSSQGRGRAGELDRRRFLVVEDAAAMSVGRVARERAEKVSVFAEYDLEMDLVSHRIAEPSVSHCMPRKQRPRGYAVGDRWPSWTSRS